MTNLITKAIEHHDLDAALRILMEPLGIASGDVAAQAFSGIGDEYHGWAEQDAAGRAKMLAHWLGMECAYAFGEHTLAWSETTPGEIEAHHAKGDYKIVFPGDKPNKEHNSNTSYTLSFRPHGEGDLNEFRECAWALTLEGAQGSATHHADGTTQAQFDRFQKRLDAEIATADANPVGTRMRAEGWEPEHTGGGCMCWAKHLVGGFYIWICDEGNGLGEKLDEAFMVGLYNEEGDFIYPTEDEEPINDLEKALAWAKAHEADPAGQFKAQRAADLAKAKG
jgi:hypothetical protein